MEQSRPVDLMAILGTLHEFIPVRFQESPADWYHSDMKRWNTQLRPQIESAFRECFINGGFDKRVEEIKLLVHSLALAGVKISGAEALIAQLTYSGVWQNEFINLIVTGRSWYLICSH